MPEKDSGKNKASLVSIELTKLNKHLQFFTSQLSGSLIWLLWSVVRKGEVFSDPLSMHLLVIVFCRTDFGKYLWKSSHHIIIFHSERSLRGIGNNSFLCRYNRDNSGSFSKQKKKNCFERFKGSKQILCSVIQLPFSDLSAFPEFWLEADFSGT